MNYLKTSKCNFEKQICVSASFNNIQPRLEIFLITLKKIWKYIVLKYLKCG